MKTNLSDLVYVQLRNPLMTQVSSQIIRQIDNQVHNQVRSLTWHRIIDSVKRNL